MSAGGAITTGAEFLKKEHLDGNLRRIDSSSEQTAVNSQDGGVGATDLQVSILGQQDFYTISYLQGEVKDTINRSPPAINLHPYLAQAVDTGTLLALIAYLSTLGYHIPSAVAAGQSSVWPSLFIVSKAFNYSGQLIDHLWRLVSTIAPKRDVTPRRRIMGDIVPKVDIIITTYNEQVENVIDTVAAAAAVDYPLEMFRVFVSDDGRDGELEKQVEELSLKYPNIRYFARNKTDRSNGSDHHGSKAGNVNDCIHYSKQLDVQYDNDPTQYFICLDADMICGRDIVRALVAHVVGNNKVGMVTLPQHFYNLPVDDPIHQDMLVHGECDEVLRDRLEAAWCPGSGFLISCEALEQLGGFPETSIAEDVLFSWILQGHGWKTVYVNEKLQWGLQPNSLASHIGQRTKWCVGHVNNSCELGFCIRNPRTQGMNMMQRLAAIGYCIKPWTTILKCSSWLIIAACLWSGQPFVAATTKEEMCVVLAVHFVFWTFTRLNEIAMSRVYGYWTLRRQTEFNIWVSPYLTFAIIRERWLPTCMGGHKLGFTSTGSMRAVIDERNGLTRGTLVKRLFSMHRDTGLLWHVVFLGFMLFCINRNIWQANNRLALLSTAMFPGLGFEQLPAFLSLLLYAINPPTDPPRRSLMVQDEHGVWFPGPEARGGKWSSWIYLQEVPQAVATLWTFAAIMLFV